MYSTLLFDNDNTLLDFEKAENSAIIMSFSEVGVECSKHNLKLYKEINDSLWKKLEIGEIKSPDEIRTERFKLFFQKTGYSFSADKMGEIYATHLSKTGFLMDGVEDMLSSLHTHYDMYIITNGISDIQRSRISHSGIGHYFKGIFISEEIGYSKPDKRYFNYVLGHIDEKDKSKIIVIGDRVSSDIQGAENSGLDSMLISNIPSEKAKFNVKSANEVKNILTKWADK